MANVMEPTINTPVEAAAAAVATATALPMTAADEDILTLVGNRCGSPAPSADSPRLPGTAGRTGHGHTTPPGG